MPEWLEHELSKRLPPVEAPDDLWERIQERTGTPRRHVRWMALAAAFALMTVGTLWLSANSRGSRTAPRPLSSLDASACALCHTSL
jgi:hypothetical protein